MSRLARFLKWVAFALIVLPIADKHLLGQQGPPPVLQDVFLRNNEPVDPMLDWISEYRAPAIYLEWWREVADCEGLPLPADSLKRVQYFQVNGPDFMLPDGSAVVYAVTYENNQTFVSYPLIWNRALVKHEALHLLLKWSGDKDWWQHDPSRFNSCGIVSQGAPPENE